MYSSGGDLHLELPSGATEGPQALWEIPPYTTKSVMKANFIARLENNHTAYIRIKTNTTGAEFLYLPLEVEVSSAAGLYCPQVLHANPAALCQWSIVDFLPGSVCH